MLNRSMTGGGSGGAGVVEADVADVVVSNVVVGPVDVVASASGVAVVGWMVVVARVVVLD